MKTKFMEAMDFRHACKAFDETKKISDEDINLLWRLLENHHHHLVWRGGSS